MFLRFFRKQKKKVIDVLLAGHSLLGKQTPSVLQLCIGCIRMNHKNEKKQHGDFCGASSKLKKEACIFAFELFFLHKSPSFGSVFYQFVLIVFCSCAVRRRRSHMARSFGSTDPTL